MKGGKTRKNPRCQCDPSCKNAPLENSPFCKKHLQFCPRKGKLSGSELNYDPDRYNRHRGIQESHNCFAYAFDYIYLPENVKGCTKENCNLSTPQPGRASGYPSWSKVKGKRCPDVVARIMGDVPGIRPSNFTARCPKGMRKIAPVVDPDQDYHFYRQDSNGYWSHKPGSTKVTHLDSKGRPIYDPQLASRDSSDSNLDYDTFCGYWCVPTKIKTHLERGGRRKKTKKKTKKH